MVNTTTLRPYSAARNAIAAAVVVLPTPPAPQHTMTRLDLSDRMDFMSSVGGATLIVDLLWFGWPGLLGKASSDALLGKASSDALLGKDTRQFVEAAQVHAVGDGR